ncbi:10217_t:CDS:2 [Scutellospora calospora]|uniref:10217_t:CDS:1 n=1 Tax=Scutellospora calospora TaxID=85575 RepID=A0ACA9KKR6_9GLOM|nr:10217_t:CDS:2 [Scutellospora calospora]
MTEPILYSDKFIIITTKNLTIKNYYFPFATSFVIPLIKIVSVDTAEELNLGFFSLKSWGMPCSNIWFALDFSRHFNPKSKIGVIKVENQMCRKGFSVEDVTGIDVLKKAWRDAKNL